MPAVSVVIALALTAAEITPAVVGTALLGGSAAVGAIEGGTLIASTLGGAIIGAGSGALSAAIQGGDIGKGALMGAVSGGIGSAIGPSINELVSDSMGIGGNLGKGIATAITGEIAGTAAGLAGGASFGQAAGGSLLGALQGGLYVGSGMSDIINKAIGSATSKIGDTVGGYSPPTENTVEAWSDSAWDAANRNQLAEWLHDFSGNPNAQELITGTKGVVVGFEDTGGATDADGNVIQGKPIIQSTGEPLIDMRALMETNAEIGAKIDEAIQAKLSDPNTSAEERAAILKDAQTRAEIQNKVFGAVSDQTPTVKEALPDTFDTSANKWQNLSVDANGNVLDPMGNIAIPSGGNQVVEQPPKVETVTSANADLPVPKSSGMADILDGARIAASKGLLSAYVEANPSMNSTAFDNVFPELRAADAAAKAAAAGGATLSTGKTAVEDIKQIMSENGAQAVDPNANVWDPGTQLGVVPTYTANELALAGIRAEYIPMVQSGKMSFDDAVANSQIPTLTISGPKTGQTTDSVALAPVIGDIVTPITVIPNISSQDVSNVVDDLKKKDEKTTPIIQSQDDTSKVIEDLNKLDKVGTNVALSGETGAKSDTGLVFDPLGNVVIPGGTGNVTSTVTGTGSGVGDTLTGAGSGDTLTGGGDTLTDNKPTGRKSPANIEKPMATEGLSELEPTRPIREPIVDPNPWIVAGQTPTNIEKPIVTGGPSGLEPTRPTKEPVVDPNPWVLDLEPLTPAPTRPPTPTVVEPIEETPSQIEPPQPPTRETVDPEPPVVAPESPVVPPTTPVIPPVIPPVTPPTLPVTPPVTPPVTTDPVILEIWRRRYLGAPVDPLIYGFGGARNFFEAYKEPTAARGGYFDADQYFADGGLVTPQNPPAMPTVSAFPTMAFTDGQGPVGTIAQPPGLLPSDSVGSDAPHASPMAPSPAAASPGFSVLQQVLGSRNANASPALSTVSQNPNVGYALGKSPLSKL